MTEIDDTVQAVRRFSRFYTALMGTLDEGFLRTALSFPESRALYEIRPPAIRPLPQLPPACASTPATSAVCSPGWRSEASFAVGFLPSTPGKAPSSSPLPVAKNSPPLIARSSQLVSEMLSPCSEEQRRKLVDAVTTIESILGVSASRDQHPFVLTSPSTRRYGDGGASARRALRTGIWMGRTL